MRMRYRTVYLKRMRIKDNTCSDLAFGTFKARCERWLE